MTKKSKNRGLPAIATTLAIGLALGVYIGSVGTENLSLVGEAQAAGGAVKSPTGVADKREVLGADRPDVDAERQSDRTSCSDRT